MAWSLLLILYIAIFATAAPTANDAGGLGIKFAKRQDELPTLTLPYATYRASKYDDAADIYYFTNIRFAAPPTGDLRFAKPAPATQESEIQDGSYGPSCVQNVPFTPFGSSDLAGSPLGYIANEIVSLPAGDSSEDCLFLDVLAPGKAIRDNETLPVVVWIYGGGYVLGSKSQLTGATGDFPVLPLYQGSGLIKQSGGNMIWVAGNYRMGAYGWLAGTTMEKEATPNLGLYDQRAVFQWVQDFIHLLGGDKSKVSAWGESAGAGSIIHHLTAFGGTQDPLFSKAVLQSPAFQSQYDREGRLEHTFQTFAAAAGCEGGDLPCLRAVSDDKMREANNAVINASVAGSIDIGPAVDGSMVRQLPTLEYASGNYWKQVDSLIVSHVSNEAEIFATPAITTEEQLRQFILDIFPPYAEPSVTDAVEEKYPTSAYDSVHDHLKAFIRDSSFTCHARYITDAYQGNTWNMQYSVTPGLHATDLLPTFYDATFPVEIFGDTINVPLIPIFGGFSAAYQSYLVSHAVNGDPNADRLIVNIPPTIDWPRATTVDDYYENVLNAGDLGFTLVSDTQISQDSDAHCDFIAEMMRAVTNMGGYAPPGTYRQSTVGIPVTEQEASANYTTP